MAKTCAECGESVSIFKVRYSYLGGKENAFCKPECKEAFEVRWHSEHRDEASEKASEKAAALRAIERREDEERISLQKMKEEKSVYVKGFMMPFDEMVVFMLKWTVASIPAGIVIAIVVFLISSI